MQKNNDKVEENCKVIPQTELIYSSIWGHENIFWIRIQKSKDRKCSPHQKTRRNEKESRLTSEKKWRKKAKLHKKWWINYKIPRGNRFKYIFSMGQGRKSIKRMKIDRSNKGQRESNRNVRQVKQE